jgi:predicted ATP-binding protein involved in virulence
MKFHFTGPEGKALDTIVIAGINGSGKTTLLETIFRILTNEDNNFPIRYKVAIDLSHIPDIDKDQCILRHELVSVRGDYWKSFNSFKDIDIKFRPRIIYVPTEINFDGLKTKSISFTGEYRFKNIVDRNTIDDVPSFIASFINGEVFKNPDLPAKKAIDKVCGEINNLFDIIEIDAKITGLDPEEKLPIFQNSAGKTFDINRLSSGEKQVFVRALALKMLNANNSIILIDEPEISMHPAWQQRIMRVYEKIGQNNQIIAATHSPHVVSSVKKESVKLLKRKNGKIEMIGCEEINGSYGLPVDIVLQELMEVDTIRRDETNR